MRSCDRRTLSYAALTRDDAARRRQARTMAKWKWWHVARGSDEYRIRELLRAIWDLHAMYGSDDPWLWRGQPNAVFNISPGIHTRLQTNRHPLDDTEVNKATVHLLEAARLARLDIHEDVKLPDMALLALLQHHGAATPLLDVSLDPMLALYMAVVSPSHDDSNKHGALFAIRRPAGSRIEPYDSRMFTDIYDSLKPSEVALYSAPDVSHRLRIQRGHFLCGRVSAEDERSTIPLTVDSGSHTAGSWIWRRMKNRGKQGAAVKADTDVAVFRVAAQFKAAIQEWLEQRTGLTRDFVYPTPWHQPHLDLFAASHRRTSNFL